jgi:hypothetical protein
VSYKAIDHSRTQAAIQSGLCFGHIEKLLVMFLGGNGYDLILSLGRPMPLRLDGAGQD